MFHPCFTNQFSADRGPTVGRLLAIYWPAVGQLSVDSQPAVGQQYLLGTVLHFHPVIEDQSRESEDLGFKAHGRLTVFFCLMLVKNQIVSFFELILLYRVSLSIPHKNLCLSGKITAATKAQSRKKNYISYKLSKCKKIVYYHAYLVFYWKNTVCKLS